MYNQKYKQHVHRIGFATSSKSMYCDFVFQYLVLQLNFIYEWLLSVNFQSLTSTILFLIVSLSDKNILLQRPIKDQDAFSYEFNSLAIGSHYDEEGNIDHEKIKVLIDGME